MGGWVGGMGGGWVGGVGGWVGGGCVGVGVWVSERGGRGEET